MGGVSVVSVGRSIFTRGENFKKKYRYSILFPVLCILGIRDSNGHRPIDTTDTPMSMERQNIEIVAGVARGRGARIAPAPV